MPRLNPKVFLLNGVIQFSPFDFPFDRLESQAEKRMFESILLFHERFAVSLNLCTTISLTEKYYFFKPNVSSARLSLSSYNNVLVMRPKMMAWYI